MFCSILSPSLPVTAFSAHWSNSSSSSSLSASASRCPFLFVLPSPSPSVALRILDALEEARPPQNALTVR